MPTGMKWLGQHIESISISGAAACCVNCRHFYQHYIRSLSEVYGYQAINFGHCGYPRMKDRMAHDTCARFEPREAEE